MKSVVINEVMYNPHSATTEKTTNLLLRYLDLPRVDTINNVVRGLSVNSATNALGSTKDLLHGS